MEKKTVHHNKIETFRSILFLSDWIKKQFEEFHSKFNSTEETFTKVEKKTPKLPSRKCFISITSIERTRIYD